MRWIYSNGGPFICIERQLAPRWGGTDSTKTSGISGPDYDRILPLSGLLYSLPVSNGSALFLNDGPLSTALGVNRDRGTVIVRWLYGDEDFDVANAVYTFDIPSLSGSISNQSINFASAHLIIFDSAYPENDYDENNIEFRIIPGIYRILTFELKPNKENFFYVHIFDKD